MCGVGLSSVGGSAAAQHYPGDLARLVLDTVVADGLVAAEEEESPPMYFTFKKYTFYVLCFFLRKHFTL